MQVIYGDASNIYLTAQKRLIRVVEGQTQATPYACVLDPTLRNSEGNIEIPIKSASKKFGLTKERQESAYSFNNSLVPGLVLVKTSGEYVTIAGGEEEKVTAFGLLGQWVGGTFDNVKSTNGVSAWRGPDSVYDLLAPAWNDKELSAEVTAAKAGQTVKLYAGYDGRLTGIKALAAQYHGGAGSAKTAKEWEEKIVSENLVYPVAEVIERASASVLRINLIV
jgi:hypothetical protein